MQGLNKNLYFFIAFFLLSFSAIADEFVVISFKAKPESTAAREQVKTDVNDRKCALIIVKTDVDLSNAIFDANPMVCDSKMVAPGEWWVYVAPGTNKLQIKKTGFIPLDFIIPTGITLESLNTYELRITNKEKNLMPEKEKQPEFVKILTSPEGAKVYLNNEYKGLTPFSIAVLEGDYSWKIEKDRYYSEEGHFTVLSGQPPTINKTLKPRFGSATISSEPEAGADIFLDGIKINQKTPYTISEISSGMHKVEVQKDMYEPAAKEFSVVDGQGAIVSLNMKAVFGEVSINTNSSADIYIDKIKVGSGSLTSKRLVSGTHLLEAKKELHEDAIKTIVVNTGSKEIYTLEPKPKTGTLSVNTTPLDAELYVDGILKGKTPMFVRNMIIGSYNIQIKMKGFGNVSKTIEIHENKTTELNEIMPSGEEVIITTNPTGAKIKIDGSSEYNTPFKGTLSYGGHSIIVIPPTKDYLESSENIFISQGEKTNFSINLKSDSKNYTETTSNMNIDMIFVQGGAFTMGCLADYDSICKSDEKPRHKVTLKDYYIGKTEITVAQFEIFIKEKGYKTDAEKGEGSYIFNRKGEWEIDYSVDWQYDARGKKKERTDYNHPVTHVTWNDAKAFCDWLSEKTGKKYTLPTEAQWEYAARSRGKDYKYAWGNGKPSKSNGGNIADITFINKHSNWTPWKDYNDGYAYTAPVGSFGTNEIGLADMTGNVWEWCSDVYSKDFYSVSPEADPVNNSDGTNRMRRGGGWSNPPNLIRCTNRSNNKPEDCNGALGFRLLRVK